MLEIENAFNTHELQNITVNSKVWSSSSPLLYQELWLTTSAVQHLERVWNCITLSQKKIKIQSMVIIEFGFFAP
jgi:hypothetical protein